MWFLLLIPIITFAVIYYVGKGKVEPGHILTIGFGSICINSLVIWVFSIAGEYLLTRDTEYRTGWIVSAVWDEEWVETYTETESYTDSDGKTQTRLVTKTRFHPDEYHVYDSNEYIISISYNKYVELREKFGNETVTNPYRSGQSSWGDGRRFTVNYPHTELAYTPCTTTHWYENRVAASHSVFKFRQVDPKKYGLFEYPPIINYYECPSILGINDPIADRLLTRFNCDFGRQKQVRAWLLVFHDKPYEAGVEQLNYWQQGNKNEIVTTLSIDNNNKIEWVLPFGWDNERLKIDLREEISLQKQFNPKQIVNIITKNVEKSFHRKQFKDFAYISVDRPWWVAVLAFLVISVGNIVVCGYICRELSP